MLREDDMAGHPALRNILKAQAGAFLAIGRESPRLAAIFAAQQRYLMGQIGVAMSFEGGGSFLLTRFLDAVEEHRLASRNTADNFIQEMLRYGIVEKGAPGKDRRARPLMASTEAIAAIRSWMRLHLSTLDAFDDGDRLVRFDNGEVPLERIHPIVVRQVFSSKMTTEPTGGFSLLAWMNSGGLLMEKMIVSLREPEGDGARVPTGLTTIAEINESLQLSRTHLSRQLVEAEKNGDLGWAGKRGRSTLWLSTDFIRQYEAYQIDKLSHVEIAFHQVLSETT